MSQTITTRYIPATNTRESRVKATASGQGGTLGHSPQLSMTIPFDSGLDVDDAHKKAALALAKRLGWSGRWVGGESADRRGLTFVLVDRRALAFRVAP